MKKEKNHENVDIYKNIQLKMKSMVQTSTFKKLKFEDPRKQKIADNIIRSQTRKVGKNPN